MTTATEGGLVAIHQPNFFPWLGFFDKVARCSRFILLDTVQFQKKGGTWGNRVKLLIGGEGRWATAPVDRGYHGVRPINVIRFDKREPWRDKLIRTLEVAYSKSPFHAQTMELIGPLVRNEDEGLASYNRTSIEAIAQAIGIDSKKFVAASSLDGRGVGTDLLVNLTRTVGGTRYLCGGGAQGYQDDQAFENAGLELIYQDFRHPGYPQCNNGGDFVPGLSIIDALMNVGIAGTHELLTRVD